MNLRKLIKRNITYSIVTVKYKDEFWNSTYYVYGNTSVKTEMKKLLRSETHPTDEIPVIHIETITEKRAISIDNFINYSIKINE